MAMMDKFHEPKKKTLLERSAPRRELTHKYQSQRSFSKNIEPKQLSSRSSQKSARSFYKEEKKNSAQTNKGSTFSTQPNSWLNSQVLMNNNGEGTRNGMPNSKIYSMSPSTVNDRQGKDYNFTSADLKAQYLTHAKTSKYEGVGEKKGSRKPPMHKKNGREHGNKSNRIPKKSKGTKINKLPPMSSAKAIEQILQGIKPNIEPLELKLPNEESTKYSSKKNGIIAGYAANTNQGIIRTYNEDRVSIILNIVKPKGKEHITKWPKCSFFAIYDGHGGNV